MARKGGLGRGLTALIPRHRRTSRGRRARRASRSCRSRIGAPNPNQPRRTFDEESLDGLAASMRELGVLQPVLVRAGDDGYELIAGERRLAGGQAGRAARPSPSWCARADDVSSLEQALVENLHRQDLNPLEEAAAYQQLIEDFGYTQDQVAERVGRSRSAVANLLRLFQLTPAVQKLVGEGLLSAGHAKALLGHPDRSYQEALAKRAVSEELSVRAAGGAGQGAPGPRGARRASPPDRGPTTEPGDPDGAERRTARASSARRGCSSSRNCWPRTWTPGCRSP